MDKSRFEKTKPSLLSTHPVTPWLTFYAFGKNEPNVACPRSRVDLHW